MSAIDDLGLELVAASVGRTATFLEATEQLVTSGLPDIAVLGENGQVLGFFSEDALLRGVFPRYLGELHHTAFTRDDLGWLTSHLGEVGAEPVERYLDEPIVVDAGSSATHIAELLLHSEVTAVAVTDQGRFVGMLTERDFCRGLLRSCRGGRAGA